MVLSWSKDSPKFVQSLYKVVPKLVRSCSKVGPKLVQKLVQKLAQSWSKVGPLRALGLSVSDFRVPGSNKTVVVVAMAAVLAMAVAST